MQRTDKNRESAGTGLPPACTHAEYVGWDRPRCRLHRAEPSHASFLRKPRFRGMNTARGGNQPLTQWMKKAVLLMKEALITDA